MSGSSILRSTFSELRYYCCCHIILFATKLDHLQYMIMEPDLDESLLKEMAAQIVKLKSSLNQHISALKSTYAGLHAFCSEKNINCNHIIQSTNSVLIETLIEGYLSLAEIKENESLTQNMKEIFLSTWNKITPIK